MTSDYPQLNGILQSHFSVLFCWPLVCKSSSLSGPFSHWHAAANHPPLSYLVKTASNGKQDIFVDLSADLQKKATVKFSTVIVITK